MISPLPVSIFFAIVLCGVSFSCRKSSEKNQTNELVESVAKRPGLHTTEGAPNAKSTQSDLNFIKSSLANASPDEILKLWQTIKESDESSGKKRILYEACLNRLGRDGHFEQGIALVQDTLPIGSLRSILIETIFSSNINEFSKLCQLHQELDVKEDRNAASGGIAGLIANMRNLKTISDDDVHNLGPAASDIIQEGLTLYFEGKKMLGADTMKTISDVVSNTKRITEANRMGDSFQSSIFSNLAASAPFELWASLKLNNIEIGDTALSGRIATKMAGFNPERAMTTLMGDGEKRGAGRAFSVWLDFDASEAGRWYEKNRLNISADFADQIQTAYIQRSLQSSVINDARQRIPLVQDPKLREEFEGRIWSKERDMLRKEVENDPLKTIQSIITGKSKYADYWIEEAMGTWVAKDFDKAQEWYQKNWNSMPANKSQFLAAAFAKQAADQGETATARQWAAHIQDAKTKQRIEAGIAKAEAAKNR